MCRRLIRVGLVWLRIAILQRAINAIGIYETNIRVSASLEIYRPDYTETN